MIPQEFIQLFDKRLKQFLPTDNSSLSKAMRYSVMAGGKRFRPYIALQAAKLFKKNIEDVVPAAAAIEMIHTFTLIHDDLPCMDDSDLRRGVLTCHNVFGEDIALLAGDALNTLAFEIIAKYCDPKKSTEAIRALSEGLIQVVRGQVVDLESEGKKISVSQLRNMHALKTAALIEASLYIGGFLAGGAHEALKKLVSYGHSLGLAFQIADDILDVTAKSAKLGKPAGIDAVNKKSTYVSILGLKKAREMATKEGVLALKALKSFGSKADSLNSLVDLVIKRES